MAKKHRGLGKGLNELLSGTLGSQGSGKLLPEVPLRPEEIGLPTTYTAVGGQQTLKYLALDAMAGGQFQPRQTINHEGIEQLADSIKAQGVLQPIVVREKKDGRYEIIAGERRWRAAQLAGISTVPALVRDITDEEAMAVALIENIQRENLNPIEEARALRRLADSLSLTHLEVAEAVGKSRASITNLLRLLSLNDDVQGMLEHRQIEMGHARTLLGLSGAIQSQMARTVQSRRLSVRETERLVKRIQEGKPVEKKTPVIDPNIRSLEQSLAERLGAKVNIRHGNKGGMVTIRYHNVDELEGILDHIQ
jgi:ParB family chromosome partitioning protein